MSEIVRGEAPPAPKERKVYYSTYNQKNPVLPVRISHEELAMIDGAAANAGVNRSVWVRRAIRAALEADVT